VMDSWRPGLVARGASRSLAPFYPLFSLSLSKFVFTQESVLNSLPKNPAQALVTGFSIFVGGISGALTGLVAKFTGMFVFSV
jgi:hypothetical protein